MGRILRQTFNFFLQIYLKKHIENTNNPSKRKYINKIENRITFKIKAEYYLDAQSIV